MTIATARLGGSAKDIVVGKVAHGLMLMTWRIDPVPDEQCFEAIKAGVDSLPPGVKMFINGGEFYGHGFTTTNLEMISRFFEKYPEYADKTFLSVKGGGRLHSPIPDASPENLRRSVQLINDKLRGTKKLDLFECARVDPEVPIEAAMKSLGKLRDEGLFDHIGISECSAETLRRAHKPEHPISVVEIEISPWSYEEETRKVIATAKELGIAVAGYSPLGRGFLTGQIKSLDDIPEGDFRRTLPRFQPEAMKQNFAIVDALTAIAQKKGITPGQLCIAWVGSLGEQVIALPGSSHAKRTLENCAGGNVELAEEELKEINKLIDATDVKGDRYDPSHVRHLWG